MPIENEKPKPTAGTAAATDKKGLRFGTVALREAVSVAIRRTSRLIASREETPESMIAFAQTAELPNAVRTAIEDTAFFLKAGGRNAYTLDLQGPMTAVSGQKKYSGRPPAP